MSSYASLDAEQYRLFVALQYLNASEHIFRGLEEQHERNLFHFLVTLRSFIEYTRRGIWFLCWANIEALERAKSLTFQKPGSPPIATMDEMISEALGLGKSSHLTDAVQGVGEPLLNGLHALTHGNPISVRMIAFGLDKIFDAEKLLLRARVDLGLFRILVCRRMLGDAQPEIWDLLSKIHSSPAEVEANVRIAADLLARSGKAERENVFGGILKGISSP